MVENHQETEGSSLPQDQACSDSGEKSSKNEQDQLAMQSLAEGNDDALNGIIERWQKPITSFLYQTIGDYNTALDLSQEVFVRLYRNRKRFKAGKSFSSYLFTIASNLAKNHFRWKSRHPEAQLDSEKLPPEAKISDPYSDMEKDERSAKVRDAVLTLPEKLRIPVTLFYFEGMSYAEIAEVLNTSTKTVETRLYRARQALKSELS